jgi:eukaryotic-like serine/threonine-protein kinase
MMVTPEGTVKLMDFGIARGGDESQLTATGTTVGSINYMSPEQVRGEATDERSDLYSVGISLYEMVTGEKPFHGDSNFSIMAAQVNQLPTPPIQVHPGIPENLNQIILTALAKAPSDRFQSADAFRNAIRQVRESIQGAGTVLQQPAVSGADVRAANASTLTGAAAAPALTPTVATPPPVTIASTTPPTHRGRYVALGAFLVVLVLIAAGIYLPSRKKAAISADNATATSTPQNEASATAQEPVTPAPIGGVQNDSEEEKSNDATAAATPAEPPAPPRQASAKHLTAPGQAVPDQPAGSSAAELDEIEHQLDQLFSRAGAVNSSLDRMQQEQARMGLGLRGDIVEKQSAMKDSLAKAQNALEHNDGERAKRFAVKAEMNLESLERFLGR